jgi:hypothetical protein
MRAHWIKYCSHWRRAVVHDFTGAAFGWGTSIATLCVAAILGLNIPQRLKFVTGGEQLPLWFSPLASTLFAILIVAAFRMVVIAPYRACRMLHPFKVKVFSGLLETQYPVGQYDPQCVAIAVENKSYLRIKDCVVHITAIDDLDSNFKLPRLVEHFSIESGETKQISLMYRTFRSAPAKNDNDITVAGSSSPGYDGNILRLPANIVRHIAFRIGIPNTEPIDMRLKVWTDDIRLYAERV